jgi:hypothetical protein
MTGIKHDDILLVDKKGRRFLAFYRGKQDGVHVIHPIDVRYTYRSCTSREVVDIWRKVRRK